jgi:hypothetical protein
MKKLFIVLMAVMFTAAFIGEVCAEDRLSLSGTLRVRGFTKTNPSAYYGAMGAESDDQAYFDQRLRIGGKIDVAEGVAGHFRMDLSEGAWGDGFDLGSGGWADASENNEIGLDRAYMTFTKDMVSVKAGQYYSGAGMYHVWDHQATGFVVNLDLPVKVMLEYAKLDEGGALTDEEDGIAAVPPATDPTSSEDTNFMGLNVGFGTDAFSANAFYATLREEEEDGETPYVLGLQGTTTLGMVNLNGELNLFGGEVDADCDYVGTQLYLDGNAAVTDAFTVGVTLLYAMGTDADDEVQRTAITAGGETFDPLGYRGDLMWYFYPAGSAYGGTGGAFDPAGSSGGVVGGAIYADFSVMESLVLHARVGSLSPQEDANTELSSLMAYAVSADYQLMDGVKLNAGYAASTPSYDDDTDDETTTNLVGQIQIGF